MPGSGLTLGNPNVPQGHSQIIESPVGTDENRNTLFWKPYLGLKIIINIKFASQVKTTYEVLRGGGIEEIIFDHILHTFDI